MRKSGHLKVLIGEFVSVVRNELKAVFTDAGVILILLGAVVIYSTAYSYAYSTEVLREVPIAVVDDCRTPESREFIRSLDAGPNINVVYKPQSLEEAKAMFYKREVYGIVVIPGNFAKNLYTTEKAHISIYADASYFLIYKQVFYDVALAMMEKNTEIKVERYLANGIPYEQAAAISDPVRVTSSALFNPYLGYGTFVMPAILVLIIQQTLLIAIGMVGGTWRERGLYGRLVPAGREHLSVFPVILGKSAVYILTSLVTMVYLFGFQYKLFHLPQNGNTGDLAIFMLPYLLSVIFLGIALSTAFRRRETSIILLLFTSIPLLMLSGVSVPVEAMPGWLATLGKIVPSTSGINGFIRIQTMGATIKDVLSEYALLWVLAAAYFLLAYAGVRRLTREIKKQGTNDPANKNTY